MLLQMVNTILACRSLAFHTSPIWANEHARVGTENPFLSAAARNSPHTDINSLNGILPIPLPINSTVDEPDSRLLGVRVPLGDCLQDPFLPVHPEIVEYDSYIVIFDGRSEPTHGLLPSAFQGDSIVSAEADKR